jgi:excisionase family DNA binding protein
MEYLSVTQAAKALGITRRAVLYRIEAGTLSATLVGAQWTIPAAAVTAEAGEPAP